MPFLSGCLFESVGRASNLEVALDLVNFNEDSSSPTHWLLLFDQRGERRDIWDRKSARGKGNPQVRFGN